MSSDFLFVITCRNFSIFPIEHKCASDRFECSNGKCIRTSFVCDGDKKCADGSDEILCECLAEQFKCESTEQCIDVRQMCNGLKDCTDGSDEKDCCKLTL